MKPTARASPKAAPPESGEIPSSFSIFVRRKTVRVGGQASGDPLRLLPVEALALEDEGELGSLPLRELCDLPSLARDLRGIELLFGLAREVGTAAHGDGAGDCLGQSGDDDQGARGIRGRHARDDAERDEQPVLRTEHEFADTREARDPLGLAQRVLGDVPLGLRPKLVGHLRPLGAHVDTVRAPAHGVHAIGRDQPLTVKDCWRAAFELSPAKTSISPGSTTNLPRLS